MQSSVSAMALRSSWARESTSSQVAMASTTGIAP